MSPTLTSAGSAQLVSLTLASAGFAWLQSLRLTSAGFTWLRVLTLASVGLGDPSLTLTSAGFARLLSLRLTYLGGFRLAPRPHSSTGSTSSTNSTSSTGSTSSTDSISRKRSNPETIEAGTGPRIRNMQLESQTATHTPAHQRARGGSTRSSNRRFTAWPPWAAAAAPRWRGMPARGRQTEQRRRRRRRPCP